MTDIATNVLAIIRKKLPPGKSTLDPSDRLQDLGIDSLSVVELIFELEEKFNIEIPYNANDTGPQLETVGEVVGAIENLVGKNS